MKKEKRVGLKLPPTIIEQFAEMARRNKRSLKAEIEKFVEKKSGDYFQFQEKRLGITVPK